MRGRNVERKTGDQLAQELAPPEHLRAIIAGSDAQSVGLLDETAEKIGQHISRLVTTSQIRVIFSAVRMIEQDTRDLAPEVELPVATQRSIRMLRPKLAYQYGRVEGYDDDPKKAAMGAMTKILSDSIAIALEQDSQARFQNFIDFFEAILAYHRRYGGRQS
jgi:CRISPR-associated protein Csm2